MSQKFIEQPKKYGNLSEETEKDILTKIKSIRKKKGEDFIKQGQIISHLFFIEQGLVYGFHQQENSQIMMWFGYEPNFFASMFSFFDNAPSQETIRCVEDCEVSYLSKDDLNDLLLKYIDFGMIYRKIIEEYTKMLGKRCLAFQMQNPKERYKSLIKSESEILKRTPLKLIASFLGISPETLSRIRTQYR